MSTSSGPMPACSKAAAAASAVGEGADSIGIEGLNTSNEPKRRVRKATERRKIGALEDRRSSSPRARTSATAPSPGEQNMYCVSGWLTIFDDRISCSDSGVRRHAFGFAAPLRNAFAATRASVDELIPCSLM